MGPHHVIHNDPDPRTRRHDKLQDCFAVERIRGKKVMLASVLTSDRAIHVNIQIVRVFTKMREMLTSNDRIFQRLENLECGLLVCLWRTRYLRWGITPHSVRCDRRWEGDLKEKQAILLRNMFSPFFSLPEASFGRQQKSKNHHPPLANDGLFLFCRGSGI